MNTMIKNSVNLCEFCVSVLNIFSSTEAQRTQSYTEKIVLVIAGLTRNVAKKVSYLKSQNLKSLKP